MGINCSSVTGVTGRQCDFAPSSSLTGSNRPEQPPDMFAGCQKSKHRSPAEVKALMEKKRGECHILENAQEHINTDAKAPDKCDGPPSPQKKRQSKVSSDKCVGERNSVNPKCRSPDEVKALMEKKRAECHVLESAQEHINTDPKASDKCVREPKSVKPKCRSPDEVKALMEKKRGECHVLESAQEHISTDLKVSDKFVGLSSDQLPEERQTKEPSGKHVGECKNVKPKGRSPDEVKALMEKKRRECHVLESAQEHMNTDSKVSDKGLGLSSDQVPQERQTKVTSDKRVGESKSVKSTGRSPAEVKALMEKKRGECHSLESAQEHINTDLKLPDKCVGPSSDQVPRESQTKVSSVSCASEGNSGKPKFRSPAEVKALMEKKRGECHVLESSQEHINSEPQASDKYVGPSFDQEPWAYKNHEKSQGKARQSKVSSDKCVGECKSVKPKCSSPAHLQGAASIKEQGGASAGAQKMGSPSKVPSAPVRKGGTSSKELEDWMSRLRTQCEISESTREFVATDAKSHALSSSPNKEKSVHAD